MIGVMESTIETVRRVSSELRPGVLDDLGLVAAIEWHAQQFQQRTGITCRCEPPAALLDVGRDQATAVFRIFQEILTNVLRHAQATAVDIRMLEGEGAFVLEVSDNGRGIRDDEARNPRSLGLLGMRERTYLVGGEVTIRGAIGTGTRVIVRVPIA